MISADALDDDFHASYDVETVPSIAAPKKRKAVEGGEGKPKRRKVLATEIAQEALLVATAVPSVQADYLNRKRDLAFPLLTDLEKTGQLQIIESFFVDVSSIKAAKPTLSDFIDSFLPDLAKQLSKPSKKKSSPRLIVVAAAALRVADICRDLKKLAPSNVAKLFAKHIKLPEQIKWCKTNAFSIAVTVPDRLGKLISEPDALLLDSCSHLMLDVSHIDQKQRSMLDQPEARLAFFNSVLSHATIQEKLQAGRLKIVFC